MNRPRCSETDYIDFLVATPRAVSGTEAAHVQSHRPDAPAHDAFVCLLRAADGTPQFALAMIEDMTTQTRTSNIFSDHVSRDTFPATATPLTKRQRELLNLVAEGLSDDEIANRVCRSPGTVRKHLQNIYRLLGVNNRHAAVWVAKAQG